MRSDDDICNVRSVGEIAYVVFSRTLCSNDVKFTHDVKLTLKRRLVNFRAIWIIFVEKQQNTSLKHSYYNGVRRIGVTLVIKTYGAFIWL